MRTALAALLSTFILLQANAQPAHTYDDDVIGPLVIPTGRETPGDLFRRAHSGYTLIAGDFGSPENANALAAEIRTRGGRISIIVGQEFLLGQVPPDLDTIVRGWTGVRFVARRATPAASVPHADKPAMRGIIDYFNATVDGTRLRQVLRGRANTARPPQNDLELPPAEYEEIATPEMPRTSVTSGRATETTHHLGYDNDIMSGGIGVNVHFIESDGTIDANTYSWTSTAINTISWEAIEGLDWWDMQAFARGLTFTTTVMFRDPASYPAVRQPYEPILRPLVNDRHLWLNEIMENYGYTDYHSNSYTKALKRIRSYNEWFRNAIGGQSAHSVFVVYNPSPAATSHTDGYYTLAVLGGPAIYHPYRPGGYSTATWGAVYAHEMGHTYWACDEYEPECVDCDYCRGGLVPRPNATNDNCENSCTSSPVECIMLVITDEPLVCDSTEIQIGW
jgi:hypothetical protein